MKANDYKKVRLATEKLIERDWGARCETKDTDDFPEMHGLSLEEGRCPVCLMYEKFDDFWRVFARGEDDI